MAPKQSKGADGFSLMELMIVMVIMSIMLALAGPRVAKGLGGLTMTTTAKKVAGSLRYARSQAVSRAQVYTVLFDREGNRVVVRAVPNPTSAFESTEVEEQEWTGEEQEDVVQQEDERPEIKTYSLPEGLVFKELIIGKEQIPEEEENVAQLSFFPDGSSQGGKIMLMDQKERTVVIAINFLTGVTTIAKEEG
jgi:type II secretion system protein H